MVGIMEILTTTWLSLVGVIFMVMALIVLCYLFWRVLEIIKIKCMLKMEMSHSIMTVAYHNNYRNGEMHED